MSERVHPRADELDLLSTLQLLELMHAEDLNALDAVGSRLAQIGRAVDAIAGRIRAGGRLHYFGAGTSGRIAALDAAECPATFGIPAELVQAHEGGDDEHEDDEHRGRDHARRASIRDRDAVVAISASGSTAYVVSAIEAASAEGALVVALTCTPGSVLGRMADLAIEIETGPEVIAGSTRLKAGTVQKVCLNMISTGVFTRLGHTYKGRMVNVVISNDKRRARAAQLVAELGGSSLEGAARALDDAGGNAKAAILMLCLGISADDALQRLAAGGGDLNVILAAGRKA